ncbi:TrmB family transcriptional regulator [Cupriavidus basilensis]|uniref:TrmB family transcriptional regulator n=1 Tax=Cupriavidus basilensis TaxID=68895 RepID=UPI001ED977AF|nr:helix-turn-helix domain-containing protein [Cupriavidus basilensis]
MNMVEMLQAAGIDGHKADFYLASLELGEATVAAIAQKAGIGRTNAYEVLDRLVASGFVSTIQKGARSYVIPQDPIMLLRKIESQRQIIQEVLPQLRSIHNSSGGKPKVRFFSGLEGIKTVMSETLECQSKNRRKSARSCLTASCSVPQALTSSMILSPVARRQGSICASFVLGRAILGIYGDRQKRTGENFGAHRRTLKWV